MTSHEDLRRPLPESGETSRNGVRQPHGASRFALFRKKWPILVFSGAATLFPVDAWSQQRPAEFAGPSSTISDPSGPDERDESKYSETSADKRRTHRKVLSLLAKTYTERDDDVEAALVELADLGVTGPQLKLGRQLVHPDPFERRRLVQGLSKSDVEGNSGLLCELLHDADPGVRIATLEQLGRVSLNPETKSEVIDTARTDPDSRVQGYARLLAAEWTLTRQPAKTTTSALPRPFTSNLTLASGVIEIAGATPAMPVENPREEVSPSRPANTAAPKKSWMSGLIADDGSVIPAVVPVNSQQDRPFQVPPEPVPAFDDGDFELDDSSPSNESGAFDDLDVPELDEVGPSLDMNNDSGLKPEVLQRPLESPEVIAPKGFDEVFDPNYQVELPAPLGFTGPSGIIPRESQSSAHFVPVEDRWRIGIPEWDRYGKGHSQIADYPFVKGHWWDPYNQNVIKGDYPIIGQHTFLNVTATSQTLAEIRAVPTPTTPFESTKQSHQEEFFGDPNQFFLNQNYRYTFDLIHGNTAFKPVDWQLRLTPVFNMNYLDVEELGIVNPNVNDGTTRYKTDASLEEYFFEMKLADLGPEYDFVSARAGNQFFASDFRGFVFSDTNRAVRLFGTQFSNRDQFNLLFLDQVEKDTNSLLNTFEDRNQNTVIANYYRQDFIYPGYTAQVSFHYNNEGPSTQFDKNNFLVRPDPVGIYQEHEVNAYYFGFAGDGHIGRFNISNAAYWVVGRDSLNPLAGRPQDINAQMVALEVSYDRDWMRFRSSFFWASGDDDISDDRATGFDTILDNPGFAGGEFSFWQRQAVKLFGVNLVQRNSLVPDLRSSKFQGQSNFVNPGLFLVNGGVDMDITPKLRLIGNANFLWFDHTQVLQQFVFQDDISKSIGTDISLGMEYRPLLTNNVIIVAGLSGFFPESGFEDLYNPFRDGGVDPLYSHFVEVNLTY